MYLLDSIYHLGYNNIRFNTIEKLIGSLTNNMKHLREIFKNESMELSFVGQTSKIEGNSNI
jgi:hypothetical protein